MNMKTFNFKNITALFLIIFLILILIRIVYPYSIALFTIPLLIYSFILFLGAKNVCSQFYMKVKCASDEKSQIHLTFDDGPDSSVTPEILKVLERHNKKATFFCIGEKIESYPEIIKKIIKNGHKIGNHSYSHSNFFDFFRTSKVIKELDKTNKLIKEISGKECTIFRPPYGVTNPNIAKAVKKLNMETVGWSIRSLDTVKDKKTVLKRLKKAKPGDIILFHDTKVHTVEILEEFLRLKNKIINT